MKRTILVVSIIGAGGLTLLASCGGSNTPLRIEKAHPVLAARSGSSCTWDRTQDQGGGQLDLSGSTRYLVEFDVRSELSASSTSGVAGGKAEGTSPNGFYAEELDLTYSTTVPNLKLAPKRVGTYFYLPPGEVENVVQNLVTQEALDALSVAVTGAETANVSISLQVRGKLSNGTQIVSNQITFPVKFFTTGRDVETMCPAIPTPLGDGGIEMVPDRVARTGPCGNFGGQDGAPLACCSNKDKLPEVTVVCGTTP